MVYVVLLTAAGKPIKMRIGSENELSPNKCAIKISKLGQNVGRSSLVSWFIFQFTYVEPFGHSPPNNGTITFLCTILSIFRFSTPMFVTYPKLFIRGF